MSSVERVGHPDGPDKLQSQRRMWRLQRLAWATILLILLAGLAGLFGGGPLSRSAADADGVLRVEYERFWRVKSSTPLRIHLKSDGERAARVAIGRQYLRNARVEAAVPAPERVEVGADHLTFVYPTTGTGELEIVLHLAFDKAGPVRARVAFLERELVFRQFVFP